MKKETFGSKLIKHYESNKGTKQLVGDTKASFDKKMRLELEKVIATHKDYADKYYIAFFVRPDKFYRSLYGVTHIIQWRSIIRKTEPEKKCGLICFSYDNTCDNLCFEWAVDIEDPSYQDVLQDDPTHLIL